MDRLRCVYISQPSVCLISVCPQQRAVVEELAALVLIPA